MHDDEVEVDDALVARLVATQLPHLAGARLERIEAWGTDHAIYRLGDDLSVRLPKIGWAAKQGEKEARWLPVLAPHLRAVGIEVPVPVAIGEPEAEAGRGYPYRWYVAPWLHGRNPKPGEDTDLAQLAGELAAFVTTLERIDATGAPRPRPGQRGGPLEPADPFNRERAEQLRRHNPEEVDVDALLEAWDEGRWAEPYRGTPVWVHGDLMDGNLVVDTQGHLSGVIDWGSLLAGDPAVELVIAWNFFDAESRQVYREALGDIVDDAMWLRGKAWAASHAIQALPYYRDTNPDICARARRAARNVIEDQ